MSPLATMATAIAMVAATCMACDASTCTSPPFDLVSWWPANGNAGDFFGVHQGVLHGNTSFVPGMVGQAFHFDGDGDYVSVPDDPAWDLGMDDFTIDLWVRFDQVKLSMFIHQQNQAALGGFEFDLQPPVGLVFSSDGTMVNISRSWAPVAATWYHVAVTRTSGSYRLYVDGVQLGSPLFDSSPVADVTGPLRIGNWVNSSTYDLDGSIDELEIVHRALSTQEIADIHNAGSSGKCPTYASRIQPSQGGNAGAVTVFVQGLGFQSGAEAKLTRSGQSDILGTATVVSSDGLSLTTTIDLTGKLAGAWSVVVTNLDASYCVIPQGFVIEEAAAPQLRVSVIGRSLIRSNRRTAYDVVIENPGNMDAGAVPVWLTGIPLDASVDVDFPLSYPPRDAGEPDWSQVPLGFTSPKGRYVPLVIPRVPPGTTVRRINVTVPSNDPMFTLAVATTPPWADGNKFRICLSGPVVSAPACMGSQLTSINAYLASHPEVQAMSGVGVWAKEAWQCEGASTLPAALAKAEQVLDYMVGPVELPGLPGGVCGDVLPPRWRDTLVVTLVGSIDPNAKLGSQGTASVAQALPYSILFENLSSATAPAQQVVVSDPLNVAMVDPATVSLDAITFGNVRIVPPPGLRSYATQVDLRPAKNLLVNVSAAVDLFTGVLSWYFSSIDPATGQPPQDPLAGFLPPNVTPPQGEGSVLFTVMPRPSLTGGAVIGNGAAITFDENAPVSTGVWQNTVEVGAPGSHVLPIAGTSDLPSFPVQWTAEGSPSDLKDYTVYVSEDGSPYRVWRLNTTASADTLAPPKDHRLHTYAFYSVARDVSGNVESPPGGPDATTLARTGVEPVGGWRLSLEGARPNPAVGAAGLHVWFTLPSAQPAFLEVMDIAGRRVARREVGTLGAGVHDVTLSRASMSPGLYFLRLTHGVHRLSARAVVIP